MQTEQIENPAPAPETIPQVPTGTKMQRRGFKSSEQVEKDGLAKGEAPPADPVAAIKASEETAGSDLAEEFTFDDGQTAATPAEEPSPPPEPVDEIRIGDKVFTSQKEALAYAQEMERQQLANDAYRRGIEEALQAQASNQNPAAQTPPVKPTIPDEYYTDPASFLQKFEGQILQKANQLADQRVSAKDLYQNTMIKFWNDNPDIQRTATTEKWVMRVYNENAKALGAMPIENGLKEWARLVKSELRELGVTTLPQKPLPSNTKPAASPGSGATVPKPKVTEPQLNFVNQFNKLKKSNRIKK